MEMHGVNCEATQKVVAIGGDPLRVLTKRDRDVHVERTKLSSSIDKEKNSKWNFYFKKNKAKVIAT